MKSVKKYVVTVITSYEVEAPGPLVAEKCVSDWGFKLGDGVNGILSIKSEETVTMVEEAKSEVA